MGNCKYCKQPAGFLSKKHKECEQKYLDGKNNIISLIESTIVENKAIDQLKIKVNDIASENYVSDFEINELYTIGFDNSIEKFLEDGILSEDEENNVGNFIEEMKLPQEVLDKNGSLMKVLKASILRELVEGKIPTPKVQFDFHLPFNFQKSEELLWVFQNVDFYEQRTKTQYRGGYSGASIKIAKGVYYRTGSFRGNPVKVEEMKYISTGLFCITNKHVYFASSSKNFRVPFNKIITMDPYENGIGLQKDGSTAKPQVFKNIDGWFTYNVISNLSQ